MSDRDEADLNRSNTGIIKRLFFLTFGILYSQTSEGVQIEM